MAKKSNIPSVKMNLATKLRMERANPLLYYKKQLEILNASKIAIETLNQTVDNFKPSTSSTVKKNKTNGITSRYMNVYKKEVVSNIPKKVDVTPKISTGKNYIQANKNAITKQIEKNRITLGNRTLNKDNKSHLARKEINKTNSDNKKLNVPTQTLKKEQKRDPNLRRSISAVHFNRCKLSEVNKFKRPSNDIDVKKKVDIKTPIKESPEFFKRRSISFSTPGSARKSIIQTPPVQRATNALEMKNRLNSWLEKRGKPLGSFHHLKCFGIHVLPSVDEINEEDKENYELLSERQGSYEALNIEGAQKTETKDLFTVAKDALYDLHKLILEGYPRDNCESWLQLIKGKFHKLEEQPQYWECRAALEEMRGNFSCAVDCYQKAIINGAEVKEVDDSLEHLLQKFSLLNLSPEKNGDRRDDHEKKKRHTQLLDARNVFKSTIINFAIQKRSLKNKHDQSLDGSYQFIATPVRRSSRLSKGGLALTPGLTVCSSLQKLDDSTRQNIFFKTNKALN